MVFKLRNSFQNKRFTGSAGKIGSGQRVRRKLWATCINKTDIHNMAVYKSILVLRKRETVVTGCDDDTHANKYTQRKRQS